MFQSIRWRLVASFVFLAVVTVLVVGFLAVEIVRRYTYQRETAELQASAEAIARQAASMISPSVNPFGLSQLVRTTAFLGNVRVRILDARRNPLVDSGLPGEWNEMVWIAPAQGTELLSPETNSSGLVIPVDPNMSDTSRPSFQSTLPPGTSMTRIRQSRSPWGGRISFDSPQNGEKGTNRGASISPERSDVVVMAPVGKSESPYGYVELSDGPNYSAEALDTTRQAFLFAGLGAGLLAAFIGIVMGSHLALPLHQLSDTADEMGRGNLAVRSQITSKDEIGTLASRFNQMAERLQASFTQLAKERDALRRFIADASHELRTPITALQNFNELLQGSAAEDPSAQAEFLSESQVQIERLGWITQNLLDLSRIDAGLVSLERSVCDVGELLQAAAAPFKSLMYEKGIQLLIELPDPAITVECDRARIELALSNLIDNAIKYSHLGSSVRIAASREGAHTYLSVADEGPGILPEDFPHIFERFYRGRNATGAGSGLGLSIVASIVQAHGGKVWAENLPGKGAKIIIEL